MYKRLFLLLLTLTLTMIITVGCNNNGDNDKPNNVDKPPQNEVDDKDANKDNNDNKDEPNPGDKQNDDENLNDNDNNNDQSDPGQGTATNETNPLPDVIEINERVIHPNGVTFILEKITFKEDHISVDFNAENGSGFLVTLASEGAAVGGNLGGITLVDDTGHLYRYVADNASASRIELKEKERVTATVSFLGRIEDDAKSLTLTFNPVDHASEDDPYSMTPRFVFENIEIKR